MRWVVKVLSVVVVSLLTTAFNCWAAARLSTPDSTGSPDSRATLARLPLAFEPNAGQAPADVRYVAGGAGYRLWLTGTEAVFMPRPAAADAPDGLRLRLVGAAATPRSTGEEVLPGIARYVVDTVAGPVERALTTFGRVRYHEVYPGIDLVFHGAEQQAEFDFVVHPGADPRAIRFELTGATDVTLDDQDIVGRAGSTGVRLRRPVVYQEVGGRRMPVEGRFALEGRRVAFEVGQYDRARPLVIDPVVTYSTYYGATGSATGGSIGVDDVKNMYILSGNAIVKIGFDGKTRVYSLTIGDATPRTMAVDSLGNAYVALTCPYPRSGAT